MPFINAKISVKLTNEKEQIIKEKLGKAIELIEGKTEEWLMIGFEDNYKLYFKGEELEKGAFIEIKIFGQASNKSYDKLTVEVCNIFHSELDIPSNKIYIVYDEVKTWGWNGMKF